MADYPSIYSTRDETQVCPPQRVQPLEQQRPRTNLMLCPDCDNPCSYHAEHCPKCGRFFQRFESTITVSRHGWMSTIAFGILLAAVLPWLIIIGIIAFLLILGGGIAGFSR